MTKLIVALSLVLVLANVLATDMPDAAVGRTYWINDKTDNSEAPVDFFSSLHGGLITFAHSRSFVVLDLAAFNNRELAYKVKMDDGQELYINRDDFRISVFSNEKYAFDGPEYLLVRQYIFARPPAEIIGAIDRKQAAAHASCLKILKTHGFLTRAQFQCGFEKYSSQMIEDARACAKTLTDTELNGQITAGMVFFDHEEKEKGHTKICEDILSEFPSYVHR